jgi:hypothetical protein
MEMSLILCSLPRKLLVLLTIPIFKTQPDNANSLPMEFQLTASKSEELYGGSYRTRHTAVILLIRNVKRCGAAFHLTSEEREVHVVYCHEV